MSVAGSGGGNRWPPLPPPPPSCPITLAPCEVCPDGCTRIRGPRRPMADEVIGSAANHRKARRKMRRRLEAQGVPVDEVARIVAERRDEQEARRAAQPKAPIPDIGTPEERLASAGPAPLSEQRPLVIARDGRWCRYCGRPVAQGAKRLTERLSIDHVTPTSRGGSNWANNRVVACSDCNGRKGSRTLEEWGYRLLPPRGPRAMTPA